MKKTPKQFAIALFEATVGKTKTEVGQAVLNFVKLLERENKIGWSKKIIVEFEKYAHKKEGIEDLEIVSASILSPAVKKQIIKKFGDEEKVIATNLVDPAILGGVILKFKDKVWDLSLKKQLQNLKNEIISNN